MKYHTLIYAIISIVYGANMDILLRSFNVTLLFTYCHLVYYCSIIFRYSSLFYLKILRDIFKAHFVTQWAHCNIILNILNKFNEEVKKTNEAILNL